LAALALLSACGGERAVPTVTTTKTIAVPTTSVTTAPPAATIATTTPATAPPTPRTVAVRYRVERHTEDDATANFAEVVDFTLADARGWSRAGFAFARDDSAPYLVVLAEGPEVDRLCLPYDTYGKYSCQNGPVVAINADRWRSADPKWTGDLATYRQMLVNHEVGHLLGQKHPKPQCPRPGQLAPVMNQQSTELDGCLPNPWPLPWEVELAARHDRSLAPPPDR
jgi:hypothetical protein